MGFHDIDPVRITDNPFKVIGKDWMLIAAEKEGAVNTMTASWGGLGVLWERNVAFCFIRPTRFTYEFVESSRNFSLSFFGEEHRKKLLFCGSHSGRDRDKIKETGLTVAREGDFVYFHEARLVLACRKLYWQDINPDRFLDPKIDDMYPDRDYHRMYVGEIVKSIVRER